MRQSPDAVMLFAAGLGTRMGPLTAQRPKPLIQVAGKALIDHALEQVRGVGRTVVNVHYRADQIRHHLANRPDILFSDETDTLLETGGGLRQALPLLDGNPVYTLNTDAVWTGPSVVSQLSAAWRDTDMSALLLLVPQEKAIGHNGRGDFDLAADGRLTRGTNLIYTGAQIIRTDGFQAIAQKIFSLNLQWDQMLAEGRLFGTVHTGQWCDVGRPESIPLAEAMLRGDHV